jgi:hypothetical protein
MDNKMYILYNKGTQGVLMEPIPITKARDCLGELASRVVFGRERIILKRHHQTLALVSIEDLRALEALEDEIDIKLADAAKKESEESGTVSWEDIKQEMNLCSTKSNSPRKLKKTSAESPKKT